MTQTSRAEAIPNYQLFVFGDSLSDMGRLFTASSLPPSPPYFQGRFSNGPVAAEYLAQALGLQISTATNFAIGGAQTGRSNIGDTAMLKLGGLLNQVDQFKLQANSLGAGPEDLYLVWAGANDFLSQPANPIAAVAAAVSNITTAVSELAQSGVKNILVAKTPNLGRVPVSLESGFLQLGTALSLGFNAALEASLGALPDTTSIFADLFSQSETIAQNPTRFGITNVTTPLLSGLSPVAPTADPSQFFFWDLVHPTTRAHSLLAETLGSAAIAGISAPQTRNGGLGRDRLIGYSGSDVLQGRSGADLLQGNLGRDRLLGGSQSDNLSGGDGSDRLTGGGGQDSLTGGAGRDRFIYRDADHGRDTVFDFQVGQDRLDLAGVLNRLGDGQSNREAYIRLSRTATGTVVRVDSNGDASGGWTPIVLLLGVRADLTSSLKLGS